MVDQEGEEFALRTSFLGGEAFAPLKKNPVASQPCRHLTSFTGRSSTTFHQHRGRILVNQKSGDLDGKELNFQCWREGIYTTKKLT